MNPREFLKLASQLLVGGNPARIRSAISRAYYAAHHVGFDMLTQMGLRISTGPSRHQDVRMALNNSNDTEVIKAGSKLGDLQSKRNQADYRLNNVDVEDEKTAQALVEQAKGIIQTLDGCCGGPKSIDIKKAIQDWGRKVGKM
jgi:uncharacterized protein (UPF0332 family)